VSYAYFTSLPRIREEADLIRIGMASTGNIILGTTSSPRQEITLRVYRESTNNRPATIEAEVPASLIAPPHILYHPMTTDLGPAYYEIVGPEIFRIGLVPGRALQVKQQRVYARKGDLKRFQYVVVGDADTVAGLAAPFDEEETQEVILLELLNQGIDLFDFWQKHANSDQMSGRHPEPRLLGPDQSAGS
jgi:hypothetical protein